MMRFIQVEGIVGNVIASVRGKKFRRRGFPHVQCILFLDKACKYKLNEQEFVNTTISAEIPSESDPDFEKSS